MARTYSRRTLETTLERVVRFLHGLVAVPTVRAGLARAGMRRADIEEGRALLLAVLALPDDDQDGEDGGEPAPAAVEARRAAVAAVNAWDEPTFARARAALRRHHPGVGDYLFHDLRPSARESDAILAVLSFLLRLDALESGSDPTRAASRADDRAAVALLARRGITPGERARVRALVDLALTPAPPAPPAPPRPDPAERFERLAALRAWYDEWAAVARTALDKRRHLIHLGLAHPRRAAADPRGTPARSQGTASGT